MLAVRRFSIVASRYLLNAASLGSATISCWYWTGPARSLSTLCPMPYALCLRFDHTRYAEKVLLATGSATFVFKTSNSLSWDHDRIGNNGFNAGADFFRPRYCLLFREINADQRNDSFQSLLVTTTTGNVKRQTRPSNPIQPQLKLQTVFKPAGLKKSVSIRTVGTVTCKSM